ncbi:MAG: BTAD domain-containing putative transcriptional regulator [Caldilineaceae bacterium]
MAQLTLYLFGPPRVAVDGVERYIRRRKAVALLAYLAVTQQPHSRDALATLFWPEYDQTNARDNLRRTLSSLHRALDRNWLEIDRATIRLHSAGEPWVDVRQFQSLLTSCQQHGHAKEQTCPDCLPLLTQAAALYNDDFLAGFTLADSPGFDDWQAYTTSQLRSTLATALARLADSYAKRGEHSTAIEHARRLAALDSLHEPAHRLLMRLYAESNQQSAALRQYDLCRQILQDELGVAPAAETVTLYDDIRSGKLKLPQSHSAPLQPAVTPPPRSDWQEVPNVSTFYGRAAELSQLAQWLLTDRCRLVTVWGMGGIGKTALAARFIHQLADDGQGRFFTRIIWRSLLNAPPLATLLADLLQTLVIHHPAGPVLDVTQQLALLLPYLRQTRCLLVLDNMESILHAERRAGEYRPGYADYGLLFTRLGEVTHQSCLLLTSRERPKELSRLERDTTHVRSLQLSGLAVDAGQQILQRYDLSDLKTLTPTLLQRYSGNPLALKLVAETIQSLFAGDIAAFLRHETLIFDDIRDVLDQHFARLSPLELEIVTWLAIEREPVTMETLLDNLVQAPARWRLLEALRALERRSLLEQSDSSFTLQNVVIEYTTERFIAQVGHAITNLSPPANDSLVDDAIQTLNRHALLKAQAKDYVRQSQERLILQPVAERLVSSLGQETLEGICQRLLARLRRESTPWLGYGGGNILNLLLYLKSDLNHFDFSQITLWHAYLRGKNLSDVNFCGADLSYAVFTDTFDMVEIVDVSPNGQLFAVGTSDGQIRVWQLADGKPLRHWQAHVGDVNTLCFSPDGHALASGGDDQAIHLWDVNSGQLRQSFQGHTNWVTSVCFSPDGLTLASGSEDQTIRLWDVTNGQLRQSFQRHTGWVTSVCFSPDGLTLASGSTDQIIRLWDVDSGQVLQTFQGHTDWFTSVCFSPDGLTLASGSEDQIIRLWDVDSGQMLQTFQGHTDWFTSVCFSPDGLTLASGSEDQTIRLWDVTNGQLRQSLQGHTAQVTSVCFSPNGRNLISSGWDQTIRLWDVRTGQALQSWRGFVDHISSVCFSPDGQSLASGSGDQAIRLWDIASNQVFQTFQGHTGQISSVCFSPDGQTLVSGSGSGDQTICLWDVASSQLLQTFQGHKHWVNSVCFSPGGRALASGSDDKTVQLWDVVSGQSLQTFQGHSSRVSSVCFSPNGHMLASGGDDHIIHLWDVGNGQALQIFQGHTDWVMSVCFSPDGQTLASGSGDQTICLWDVAKGEMLRICRGHTNWITSVCFSPDGQTLISGSADQTVRLWDVVTGQQLRIFQGHSGWVTSVCFRPDGQLLASGSTDGTIRLWDVQTGSCLKILRADRPYERMNITGVTGLSEAQKATLKALGAVETVEQEPATVGGSPLSPVPSTDQPINGDSVPVRPRLVLSTKHNLPTQTTTFIGRERELADIAQLLLNESSCQLLNLVGPGGIGKTRLALAAATQMMDAFPDGVFFVPLAPVSEAIDIVPTIAEALRFTFYGSHDPKEQLLGYLGQKHLLLILDNFEHLLGGVDLLAAILVQAPGVTLLTTARERLQLQEEWIYAVQGLAFPAHARQDVTTGQELDYLESYSAVQLFLQRARQVMANVDLPEAEMAAIARICQLVEGMPLGIELAAPWLRTLSCQEIATEIAHSLDFLATSLRNVPDRHRSLRVIFDQTWERLSQTEQATLMRLSIFRGGCTREAALTVTRATLPMMSSLVDKALLRRTNTGRYTLHELIRQFAEMRLQADPEADEEAQDRHAAYFTTFLLEREIYLKGMDQQTALAEIEADSDNIRQAWRWAVREQQVEYVNQAICSLGLFYRWRGGYQEGEEAFRGAANEFHDKIQSLAKSSRARLISAKLFMWQGVFTSKVKQVKHARQLFQQSLAILDRLELTDRDTQLAKADALLELGFMSNGQEAKTLYEQSLVLYQALDDQWGMASVLQNLGFILSGVLGDYEQGRRAFEESMRIRQSLGDQRGTARLLLALGSTATDQEKFEEAEGLVRQGVMICQEVGLRQDLASSFRQWGELLLRQGKFIESRARFEESVTIYRDLGNQRGEIISRLASGEANLHLGQFEQVRTLAQLAVPISQHLLFREGYFPLISGCLALIDNDYAAAERLLEESVLTGRESGRLYLGWALAYRGYAKCLLGEHTAAKQILLEALTIGAEIRAFLPLVTALPAVALLKVAQGEMNYAIELYAVASRYPYVANSRWFGDVVGHRMAVVAENLPPEMVTAARMQGQTRDLWVTAANLIREFQDE